MIISKEKEKVEYGIQSRMEMSFMSQLHQKL